jgi:hypothetical protein
MHRVALPITNHVSRPCTTFRYIERLIFTTGSIVHLQRWIAT